MSVPNSRRAGVAQLVEQLIRNQQVTRSSRVAGSTLNPTVPDTSRRQTQRVLGLRSAGVLGPDTGPVRLRRLSVSLGNAVYSGISREFVGYPHDQLMIYQLLQ